MTKFHPRCAYLLGSLALCVESNAAPISQFRDLGPLGFGYSDATGINNAGLIVGSSYVGGNEIDGFVSHATLWSGSSIADLGTLGGTNSVARAINDARSIGGSSDTASRATHATLCL